MAFPVTEDRIVAAEEAVGCRLPAAYRQRLLSNNGGEVQIEHDVCVLFPVWDPSDKKRMKRTANHLIKENEAAKCAFGFPDDTIAIASDSYGNYLVHKRDGEAIEFWDHETGECEPVEIDWA